MIQVAYITTFTCDGEHLSEHPMVSFNLPPAATTKMAQKSGWTKLDGLDYCPDCTAMQAAAVVQATPAIQIAPAIQESYPQCGREFNTCPVASVCQSRLLAEAVGKAPCRSTPQGSLIAV